MQQECKLELNVGSTYLEAYIKAGRGQTES
jgi:hypothetical protein